MGKKFVDVEIMLEDGSLVTDYQVKARDAVLPRVGDTMIVPIKGKTHTLRALSIEHYLHVEPENGKWGKLAQQQVKIMCAKI